MADDLNAPLANGLYQFHAVFEGLTLREIAGQEGSDNDGGSTAQRTWLIRGTDNPIEARAALLNGPIQINTYDGLFRSDISRTYRGPGSWEFTVTYSQRQPAPGAYTVSIDTSGGLILQTVSLAQNRFPAPGQTAPDFRGGIDVQDGAAQGVERIIPALTINVRAKIARQYVISPMKYAKLISRLTGYVNQAPMFDGEFAAGELLFAGGSGDLLSEEPTLSFTFLASANATGLTVGEITGINKGGHEYLWFLPRVFKDPNTNLHVVIPRAAYVDRVYGLADLELLKIGVAAIG